MRIKYLRVIHVEAYMTLRLQSFQESPLAFSESLEDEKLRDRISYLNEIEVIGEPPEQFMLGTFTNEEKLIGFLKFRRDQRSFARHKAMIHAMYVDPLYRDQKVGMKLINHLDDLVSRIDGLEQIHLWVLHSDQSANTFYSRCGFVSQGLVVKKDLKIFGRYVDAEYMVKHLI